MAAPYEPELYYLCDDPDCCWNGCPKAHCRICHETWPCPDFVAAHTEARVRKEIRWIQRKWAGSDEHTLAYFVDHEYAKLVS